jgi:hypothetical protein
VPSLYSCLSALSYRAKVSWWIRLPLVMISGVWRANESRDLTDNCVRFAWATNRVKSSLHNTSTCSEWISVQLSREVYFIGNNGCSVSGMRKRRIAETVAMNARTNPLKLSPSPSRFATDGQSPGLSWYRPPSGTHDQNYVASLTVTSLESSCGVLSDYRTGPSVMFLGLCQVHTCLHVIA